MRVVIVEDSGFLRTALADALTSLGVVVINTTDSVNAFYGTLMNEVPDVAILDICLPPTRTDEGLVAAEYLAKHHPSIGVLVLSAHLSMAHVSRLLTSRSHSVGCLSKDQLHDDQTLLNALHRIEEGGTYVDPQFVAARFRADQLAKELTQREMDTLRSLAQGLSNQGIANELNVSVKTVEGTVTSIFRKLNVEGNDRNARVSAVLAFMGNHFRN